MNQQILDVVVAIALMGGLTVEVLIILSVIHDIGKGAIKLALWAKKRSHTITIKLDESQLKDYTKIIDTKPHEYLLNVFVVMLLNNPKRDWESTQLDKKTSKLTIVWKKRTLSLEEINKIKKSNDIKLSKEDEMDDILKELFKSGDHDCENCPKKKTCTLPFKKENKPETTMSNQPDKGSDILISKKAAKKMEKKGLLKKCTVQKIEKESMSNMPAFPSPKLAKKLQDPKVRAKLNEMTEKAKVKKSVDTKKTLKK